MDDKVADVIRLNSADVDRRISDYEAAHPGFPAVWSEPSCSCCKPDWTSWGIDKLDAWDDYRSLRWLRGDPEPGPEDDDG